MVASVPASKRVHTTRSEASVPRSQVGFQLFDVVDICSGCLAAPSSLPIIDATLIQVSFRPEPISDLTKHTLLSVGSDVATEST